MRFVHVRSLTFFEVPDANQSECARTMSRGSLSLPPGHLGVAIARVLVSIGARTSLKPISCADWTHAEGPEAEPMAGMQGPIGPSQ